ncbi:hypothetical protein H2198_009542 [Neophaeococcomyces mojaviensis]|uniref:Uncharacterized protein n=1 Tax=Neophaeococcomyces mojaviensis TaxID=3383035 RepID=A0ACC2ZU63_9EURO|nr:hypothetical protein H2198_009542 [Knufia sp. JES_112]
MPSSSLFLRSSTTLATVLSLFSASASATDVYNLATSYKGNDFLDTSKFNYFNGLDPNKGYVTYLDKDSAVNANLVGVESDVFYMSVDSQSLLDTPDSIALGSGRSSVRIESTTRWTKGLWIADIGHMPTSTCGLWPAYWTLGENWPNNGEIDIIEGVNDRDYRISVLHDGGPGSEIDSDNAGTGQVLNDDCYYNTATGAGATGCVIKDSSAGSYGTGFNSAGGRIVAMEWTSDAIKIWTFAHGSAPSDINSANPNPDAWPEAVQIFHGDDLDIDDNFNAHQLIFNTNFCGDFGNAVWSSEGCAGQTGYDTCAEYVAYHPGAFAQAFWAINGVKVYQKGPSQSTTTTTTTATTSKTSTTTTEVTTTTTPSIPATTTTTTFSVPYPLNGTTSTTTSGHGTTTTSDYETTTSTTSWSTSTRSRSSSSRSRSSKPTGDKPSVSVTAFPQGTGIPGSWDNWVAPGPKPSFITTTITKTYVVPCSTGLETKTATITTSFVGGKPQTFTPEIPLTTYTTSCPAEWGFGGRPVTVTAPITNTVTVTIINGKPTVTPSNANGDGSWNAWDGSSQSSASTKATPAANSATATATASWGAWTDTKASTTCSSMTITTVSSSFCTTPTASDVTSCSTWHIETDGYPITSSCATSKATPTPVCAISTTVSTVCASSATGSVKTPDATGTASWGAWNGASTLTTVKTPDATAAQVCSTPSASTTTSCTTWHIEDAAAGYPVTSSCTTVTASATPVCTSSTTGAPASASATWAAWNPSANSTVKGVQAYTGAATKAGSSLSGLMGVVALIGVFML